MLFDQQDGVNPHPLLHLLAEQLSMRIHLAYSEVRMRILLTYIEMKFSVNLTSESYVDPCMTSDDNIKAVRVNN